MTLKNIYIYFLSLIITTSILSCNDNIKDSNNKNDQLTNKSSENQEVIVNKFIPDSIDNSVRLYNWNAGNCDNSYNPYNLVHRISDTLIRQEITYITFSFSANCCSNFEPRLYFKNNELHIDPYSHTDSEYCDCNCCFSIQIGIEGLIGKKYKTIFDRHSVVYSEDPYPVFDETSELFDGKIINRTNKYRMKEGLWITYNKDSSTSTHQLFKETATDLDQDPIWTKVYLKNNILISHYRKDSSERWFESGKPKYKRYKYYNGDTTYSLEVKLYENGTLEKNALSNLYPTTFYSEFDPEYTSTGSKGDIIYDEEYYESGQLKHKYSLDTTRSWHSNGQISILNYSNGKIGYDSLGTLKTQSITWHEKGPIHFGDLNFTLYIEYHPNGIVSEVHYDRDEPDKDGVSVSVDYYWQWDKFGKLIKYPRKWNEPLPWTQIKTKSNNMYKT
jgi:hypothetical protein